MIEIFEKKCLISFKIPILLEMFLQMTSMCSMQENLLSIITFRNFKELQRSISLLFKETTYCPTLNKNKAITVAFRLNKDLKDL